MLAIGPTSPSDWVLENALSVAGGAALALSYRRFRFSRVLYAVMFVSSPCTSADDPRTWRLTGAGTRSSR